MFEARENDVSRNRDPKRIVADEGDLDEDPDDRKPRENKREDEYKIDGQCLAPRGPRRTPDSLWIELIREQPSARNSSRKRHPPTTVEPTGYALNDIEMICVSSKQSLRRADHGRR